MQCNIRHIHKDIVGRFLAVFCYDENLTFLPVSTIGSTLDKVCKRLDRSTKEVNIMKIDNLGGMLEDSKKFVCGAVEGFYGRPWSTEQRKTLFSWLKKMGLNTYMYAPKDDCKHRAFWRELYSVEEAENMTALINAAKECSVEFIYAISPGLDITFSSSKDVQCLKRKLEQVATFGCNAFALLFDDIDPELSETDRGVYQSFGGAQVSVSNEVFEHLGQPHFYFCPTEYCSSRAVPDLASSEYLNLIGSKLLPGIEILWTGNKVITKKITVPHLIEISSVLRRPPIIWDNIHANDYDPRRLFLGPYEGRSPEIIPYLRGVLSNPNCEFEANFVALHTLGQWSQSNNDGVKKDIFADGDRLSPVASDIKLETECDYSSTEDIPARLDTRYQPRVALKIAVNEWLPELASNRNIPIIAVPNMMGVSTCMSVTPTTTSVPSPADVPPSIPGLPDLQHEDNLSFMQPTMNPVNSLVSPPLPTSPIIPVASTAPPFVEPMDVVPSSADDGGNSVQKNVFADNLMQVEPSATDGNDNKLECEDSSGSVCDNNNTIIYDDLVLLVDLFYMPFEHGAKGVQMLQDLFWLKSNANFVIGSGINRSSPEQIEWMERADKFTESVTKIHNLSKRLYQIPNNCFIQEMFPYLWDMLGVLETCSAYVSWLKFGQIPVSRACQMKGENLSWCSNYYKDAFTSGEQEPWKFRGGLQGEFEILRTFIACFEAWRIQMMKHLPSSGLNNYHLLPLDNAVDLLCIRTPEVVIKTLYRYRPYAPSDESAVYNVCLKTCDDGMDGTEVFPDMPELIGDRILGSLLTLSSQYCFVVQDDEGVCGYAVATVDSRTHFRQTKMSYLPVMCEKYPQPEKEELSPADEVIMSFHNEQRVVPESVLKTYPAAIRVDFIPPRVIDYAVPKRLLVCALNALKTNGADGVHVEMNVGDKCMIDHYRRLGFSVIDTSDKTADDVVYLGRMI